MAKDRKQAKAAERKQKLKAKHLHQEQVAQVHNRIEKLLDLDPDVAVERLAAMRLSHPDDRHVLTRYFDACLDAKQFREMLRASRDWVARHPDDREVWRTYAGVCFQENYVHEGQRAARIVVQRWPNSEEARVCGLFLVGAEEAHAQMVRWSGPNPTDEMLAAHEAVRDAFEAGETEEAVRLATPAAARWPECQPIRNNLALALGFLGRYDEAILECRSAWEAVPGNVFAGATLTRSLYLLGRDAEARQALETLLTSPSERNERWSKVAEMLALVGQEERLLAWARPVIDQNQDQKTDPIYRAMLRHYTACAEYRLGDERAARLLWREALKCYRIPVAAENLADLDRPVDERHAAWYFPLHELFPRPQIDELTERLAGKTNAEAKPISREFLQRHPTLRRLLRVLLERGDATGREFACRFCHTVADEESLDLLQAFSQGQWGPLTLRMRAAETLREHGRLTGNRLNTWTNGKQTEVLALSFNITREPMTSLTDKALLSLIDRAHSALKRDDYPLSEKLFEEASQRAPDDPGLQFNLAVVRKDKRGFDYDRAVQEIHERWPDYGFARMAVAMQLTRNGQLQEARNLVVPCLDRSELHFTEFRMLAMCQVEIELAAGQIPQAKVWLDMAKKILPGDADLIGSLAEQITVAEMRDLVNQPGFKDRMVARFNQLRK